MTGTANGSGLASCALLLAGNDPAHNLITSSLRATGRAQGRPGIPAPAAPPHTSQRSRRLPFGLLPFGCEVARPRRRTAASVTSTRANSTARSSALSIAEVERHAQWPSVDVEDRVRAG